MRYKVVKNSLKNKNVKIPKLKIETKTRSVTFYYFGNYAEDVENGTFEPKHLEALIGDKKSGLFEIHLIPPGPFADAESLPYVFRTREEGEKLKARIDEAVETMEVVREVVEGLKAGNF